MSHVTQTASDAQDSQEGADCGADHGGGLPGSVGRSGNARWLKSAQ
jgi:hypothetical protein